MNQLHVEQPVQSKLASFFSFRTFAMPVILQILFWAAIAGNLYGTWWLFSHDNWAWIMSLIFGSLLIRVLFEHFILRYQTYQLLRDIRDKLHETS